MMFCHSSASISRLIGLLGICMALASCHSDRLDVDVSGVEVPEVQIRRFDRDFFALNAENISGALPGLRSKYPDFADLYINNLLCPHGVSDSSCVPEITRFVADKDMREAYDDAQKVFPDMKAIEDQLRDVFRHYKYYNPNGRIPQIIAMMSGFNYAIEMHDSTFSIGLEMYLGSKTPFYENLQLPVYKRMTMRKEYIVSDLVHAWMAKSYPNKGKSGTLLNEMIYQGKILYLVDALLPEVNDTLKIGYTKKQLDWCTENENNMWGYLIKNKLLYSNEITDITKFTGEGPFTTGFVKESPARTGVWIGWHIVRKYMENNPKVTFEDLMKQTDPQMILSQSKYKP
jgi:gliding motility-associated lipoprotein GldB